MMTRTSLGIAIFIIVICCTTAASGAENAYDGHYWRECPTEMKHLFVHGVMSGVLLGQDRVIRYGLADQAAQTVDPQCQQAVEGVVNSLERQIENWDRDRFLEAIDAFYSDPDHLDLNVRWAMMVVMLELHGAAPEDIQKAIRQIPAPTP